MLSEAFLMLMGSAFVMLRLGPAAGTFPRPLTAKEEQSLLTLWQAGDLQARNTLIEHNLRLVAHIMKKYYTSAADQDDLISIGTIGLIKGISSFRPEKGVRLATYASRCIENEILMYFRRQKKNAANLSLSEALEPEEDGGLSLMDVVAEDEDLSERVVSQELKAHLRKLVETRLHAREAEIIRLRYGLNGKSPLTQREVAEVCGISRSYVSRIEKRALEKLKSCLE